MVIDRQQLMVKILFWIAPFLMISNCTTTFMPTNKKQIEADLLQYLKSEYDQEFVIESIQWMANEGSSGLPDIHEIVAHPLVAPGLAFGGRVGYNKNKKFFVSFFRIL